MQSPFSRPLSTRVRLKSGRAVGDGSKPIFPGGPADPNERPPSVPKAALFGAGLLVAVSFAAAIYGQANDITFRPTLTEVTETRLLRFEDVPGEGLAVFEVAETARDETRRIGTLDAFESGFIRGVLRGVSHNRRRARLEPPGALRFIRTETGQLALIDPATEERLDLMAFGPDNRARIELLFKMGS